MTRTRVRERTVAPYSAARSRDEGYLVDTHIWLWWLNGDDRRLARPVMAVLDAAASARELFVSEISYWEVALKARRGGLSLRLPVEEWVRRAETAPGVRHISADRSVLVRSALLDDALIRDPADRILIASAMLHGLTLVTADAKIQQFARKSAEVRTLAA